MKAALCAGGTGGHLLPAVVLFRLLKTTGWDVKFLCREKDAALSERLAALGGDLVFLSGRGLPRRLTADIFPFLAALAAGFFQSLRFMKSFRPDVVVTFGGYLGFAPALAAWLGQRPVVMIEQNSVAGLANRLLAPFCRTILLHFASAQKQLRRGIVTGHPIDPAVGTGSRKKALAEFGLDPSRKTLLITGGSQGALGLNRIVLEAVKTGELSGWNVLWSCGRAHVRDISAAFGPGDEGRVAVAGFFEDMPAVYAAADVAVCRAGASTLSELAACGLPAVLVPFPAATDDHQYLNARVFGEKNRSIVIREKDLTVRDFILAVRRLAEEPRGPAAPEAAPRTVNGRIVAALESATRRKGA